MTKKFHLNSHNEWDKLQEIIVGTAKNSTGCFYWKEQFRVSQKKIDLALKLSKQAFPKWYIDEVEEDLVAGKPFSKLKEDLATSKKEKRKDENI